MRLERHCVRRHGADRTALETRPDGKWSLVYDSKASHLLSVAIGPDGSVYAGSDGEGLIYRVSPDGKTSILFDAPQPEIRCLLWGADGALYAGTAAESGWEQHHAELLVYDPVGRTPDPGSSHTR